MKYLSYTIILIFIIISYPGCSTKEIKIKLPYAGDKIVINAIITNDSIVYAHITKSAAIQTNLTSFEELPGCKADIYENDIFKETLTEKVINAKRYYVSAFKVKSAHKYSIKVSLPGLQNAEGSDEVPVKPAFLPLDYWKLNNSPDSTKPYKVTLKLKDIAGAKNYYRLRIFPASYNTNTRRYTISRNSSLNFSIDNFTKQNNFFESFGDNLNRIIYFTDETFDGQEITLTISLGTMSSERLYIAPELVTLSEQSFKYFNSKEKQINNEDNPFAEAVMVYNNIKGGYGIVGGMADSIAVVRRSN